MSAEKQSMSGAGAQPAPDKSQEQDVRIPVEVDDSAEAAQEPTEDQTATPDEATSPAADEAETEHEMTEDEMVEAAIRAGEEAADNDFKVQLDIARKDLDAARVQLEDARSAQEAAEKRAQEASDRTARLQADWENFRRRTAAERVAERDRATEKLVMSILPVLDDMERAIAHANTIENMGDDFKSFVDGVSAVHTKLLGAIEKEGVEVIDPAGQPFDPLEHQAVGRVEDASQYDETVNDVYQKGYRMGDHVIRTAMVTVTYGGERRPAPAESDPDSDAGDAPESAETE